MTKLYRRNLESRIGRWFVRVFPWYPEFLWGSGINVYPVDYSGRVISRSIILSVLSIIITMLILYVGKGIPLVLLVLMIITVIFTPFTYLVGRLFIIPVFKRSMRAGKAKFEGPYAVMYMAVLSKGLSLPHVIRLFDEELGDIFPYISSIARRIRLYVEGLGMDYLTAFIKIADTIPDLKLRDFMHGYVATVKAGGDVSGYVFEKAVGYLDELVSRIKSSVNSLSLILYGYLAMVIFSDLALAILYLSNVSLSFNVVPGPMGLSSGTLIMVMGIGVPFITFATILVMDGVQYKEPVYENRWYIVIGATIWLPIILLFLGKAYSHLPHGSALRFYGDFINSLLSAGGLDSYYYSGVMVAFSLLVWSLIVGIAEYWLSRNYGSLNMGVISFFRDLSEIKKTGLPLEKCLVSLSRRKYGAFTMVLRAIVFRMTIAPSLKKAVGKAFQMTPLWKTRMLLSLLRDSIEAGGGTSAVFDAIASFLEKLRMLESEKKSSSRTLVITPYIGGILIIFSVISLVSFGSIMSNNASFSTALNTLLPLIAFNIWTMGFVVGKAGSGRTVTGFKHAAALLMAYLVTLFMGNTLMGFVHVS